MRAWRTSAGGVFLSKEPLNARQLLHLPCGGCLGCRTAAARAWALRCQLELQEHNSAVFTTLTYDEAHVPITLQPRHLQAWIKRLRRSIQRSDSDRSIRFFASGEYGEKRGRPHYHALVFGASEKDADLIQRAWSGGRKRQRKNRPSLGNTVTEGVTPARIAYVAGYTQKKIGYRREAHQRLDRETGELYRWQPPFIQMSTNPGIGGEARKYVDSWRSYAVHNGRKMPVPRYLHEAWKAQATPEEIEQLSYEKEQHRQGKQPITREQLEASEKIAAAKQALDGLRRPFE